MSKNKTEKGISVYLVILLSTFILAIALGLSTILVSQIKMSHEIGESVIAFYAADTGIEAVLKSPDDYPFEPQYSYGYLDLDGGGTESSSTTACTTGLGSHPEDSCYSVTKIATSSSACPDDVSYCIDSVGYFKKTRRAIQISR